MKSAVICFVFLVTGTWAQDTIPEFPIDFPPPTTTTTTTEGTTTTTKTEEPTIPTTESIPTITTEPTTKIEVTTVYTTEPTTSTTEPTTTFTAESTTTSTTEPTTTSTTEFTTTTTTNPTTTSTPEFTTTTEITTTSTTEPTLSSTTQKDPIVPTYRPPYVRPTTSKRPWSWSKPADNCYLKEQLEYSRSCYGWGWQQTTVCYRCCYYDYTGIAGCSKLHKGRCSWYNFDRWSIQTVYDAFMI